MATIRIADQLRPNRSHEGGSSSTDVGGGVYPIRSLSLERRSSRGRSRSADRRGYKLEDDAQEQEGGDQGLRQAGDFKKKQVCWNLQYWTAKSFLVDTLTSTDIQRQILAMACISEHRGDLYDTFPCQISIVLCL